MKVFLSSTCYDLKDLRAEVEHFLHGENHETILSDRNNFPIQPNQHRHDICLENVSGCDLFLIVIDSRFGASYYKDAEISITWAEFRKAVQLNKEILVFVRKEIFSERQTYNKNIKLGNTIVSAFADNIKTFKLLDEIQADERGIWIQPFENSIEIKTVLENLNRTNHSPLNTKPLETVNNTISLKSISSSSKLFIKNHNHLDDSEGLTSSILRDSLELIPDVGKIYGEYSLEEEAPQSDEFIIYSATETNGKRKKIIVSPTALGKAVKSELSELLRKITDEDNVAPLFLDIVKRKPLICKKIKTNKTDFIIGVYEKKDEFQGSVQCISVLKRFANNYQIDFEKQLDEYGSMPEILDNFTVIKNENDVYFYFERSIQHFGTANNGLGTVEFSIIDFESKSVITLSFEGAYRDRTLEGSFNFDQINEIPKSEMYKYLLEERASKSKLIYRTSENYDINDSKNHNEKWNIENPDFFNNETGRLAFVFYEENILYDISGYKSLEEYKATYTHEENDQYLIFFYFAGPALGLRKSDNSYFVVYVPQGYGAGGSWGMRSVKSITFIEPAKVIIRSGWESVEIDLEFGNYIRNVD